MAGTKANMMCVLCSALRSIGIKELDISENKLVQTEDVSLSKVLCSFLDSAKKLEVTQYFLCCTLVFSSLVSLSNRN